MSDLNLNSAQVDQILTAKAVRQKSQEVLRDTESGHGHFVLHRERLAPTVEYVLEVIRKKYPRGDIPFHSRWGHFRAGGIDRVQKIQKQWSGLDRLERARCELDLVITSVLLDAGAGSSWSYLESESRLKLSRSEGLGVASVHMFLAGAMAADKKSSRADAQGLMNCTDAELEKHFQVNAGNPLLGVSGRVGLLNQLGRVVDQVSVFKNRRPGNILDYLLATHGQVVPAPEILRAVLKLFGGIWPGRLSVAGQNLGDVWMHSRLGLVPLHKLSQWMTYSLIEPIEAAGVQVTEVEGLTGLAEYRNGGLMIDSGLLTLRDPEAIRKSWRPESDLILEWRALTVALLDLIGSEVQKALGKSPKEFPLAKVLEGGTWWAGRFIAQEKRSDGGPPLKIDSDGTVF